MWKLSLKSAALALVLASGATVAHAASIAGRVTNEVTGDPIVGATVFILAVPFSQAGQGTTDALGNYQVTGLPAGSYIAGTQPAGFAGEVYDNIPVEDFPTAPPIVLGAADARTDIDFALQPLRRISGTVTRTNGGAAIEGVTVEAISASNEIVGGGATAPDGTYELFVASGTYHLRASSAQFLGEFSDGTPCNLSVCDRDAAATVTANADVAGVDFTLLAGGRIAGNVRDAVTSGVPSEAIRVSVAQATGELLAGVVDNVVSTDGTWQSSVALPAGSYRVFANSEGGAGYRGQVFDAHDCPDATALSCEGVASDAVTVALEQTVGTVDFDLAPTTGRISGAVTAFAGGAPLAGVAVQIAQSLDGGTQAEVISEADGSFRFLGVAPGSYVVRAVPTAPLAVEYFPNVQCQFPFTCGLFASGTPTPIVVTAGNDRTGVDFALAPMAVVSVTLRNSVTAASTGGELLVERNGVLAQGREFASAGGATDVRLPGGGTIRIAGWGRNTCGTNGDEWCLGRLYPNIPCPQLQCRFDLAETLTLTKGQRLENIVLDMDVGATIAGTVTSSADGSIIGNQFVEAVSGNLQVAASLSDGDGHYELVGLGGGPYAIRTRSESDFVDELYNNITCPQGNCLLSDGTLLAPAAGARIEGIDFALANGAHIAGTVRSSNSNAALPGARVVVFDSAGVETANVTATTGGVFRTQALPSGRYYLKVSASAHLPELFDGVSCTQAACDPLGATPIDLVAPTDRTGVAIVLAFDSNGGSGPGSGPTGPPTIVYINRCEGGCTLRPGNNSSINNVSSIVGGTGNLSAFPHGDERFEELVACLRDVFAPFNITITSTDPGNVPHHENMVGGQPTQLGFGSSVGGVSPFSCGLINNSITFTFAQTIGNNLADLCDTSAMEIAHSFGLDHEVHCEDPMTYLTGCGAKRFINADVPCGEFGSRACQCGGTTQNSFQSIVETVGIRQNLFIDGFEDDTVTARMKAEYERGLNAEKRFQRDHCGTHEN